MRDFLSRIAAVNSLFGAGQRAEPEMEDSGQEEERELLEHLEKAREQWLIACNTFEAVAERELVDAAIYTLDAAERRYMYLWRLVKERGLAAADAPESVGGGREGLWRGRMLSK